MCKTEIQKKKLTHLYVVVILHVCNLVKIKFGQDMHKTIL